jgi:hypothetical protein
MIFCRHESLQNSAQGREVGVDEDVIPRRCFRMMDGVLSLCWYQAAGRCYLGPDALLDRTPCYLGTPITPVFGNVHSRSSPYPSYLLRCLDLQCYCRAESHLVRCLFSGINSWATPHAVGCFEPWSGQESGYPGGPSLTLPAYPTFPCTEVLSH